MGGKLKGWAKENLKQVEKIFGDDGWERPICGLCGQDGRTCPCIRKYTVPEKVVFSSGASRSEIKPRYDLIPRAGIRYTGERFGYGALPKEEGGAGHGADNWKQGEDDSAYIEQTYCHLLDHVLKFGEEVLPYLTGKSKEFRTSDPHAGGHLGAIGFGQATLAYFLERKLAGQRTPRG